MTVSASPDRAQTGYEGNHMLAVAGVWKKKRDELNIRRKPLFEKYTKHPSDHELAVEIKTIDDESAECTQNLEQESRAARPASPAKKLAPP